MKRAFGLVSTLLLTLPAYAGVVYEVEGKNLQDSPDTVTNATISVEGMAMKMAGMSSGGDWDGEMIFHGDSREMVIVDHKERSYFVVDEEQLRAISSQVSQAMASMEQALAALPESQRAQMEQMMKSRMPAMGSKREPSELKRTGETDTINGYPCVKYEVWRAGAMERELWVTEWKNVEGGAEVAAVFGEMAEFMKALLDNLPADGGQGGFGDPTLEHMKELNGFPVLTREYGDGVVQTEGVLKSAQKASLGPADFVPPKKYNQKKMF